MSYDRPTFGSLFAGIGGIDLGLERAGWRGRWQVEYEPFCQRVLARHWPDVQRYGDIHDVDWSGVERVDLVAGGFPCQPVSGAGRQKAQADERWLWPEFLRCIRALRPRYVLVENVTNLLAINGGSAFGDVLGDLAASGYDAEWDCIPASAVGALHERDRVWLVAYPGCRSVRPDDLASQALRPDGTAQGEARQRERGGDDSGGGGSAREMADSDGSRPQGREVQPERAGERPAGAGRLADTDHGGWLGRTPDEGREPIFGTALGGPSAAGGWGRDWLTEPDVGRVAHAGVPARVDRLRALGNAVVPQVVEFIGRRILEAEALT